MEKILKDKTYMEISGDEKPEKSEPYKTSINYILYYLCLVIQ